jgi:proline iminopeptidase
MNNKNMFQIEEGYKNIFGIKTFYKFYKTNTDKKLITLHGSLEHLMTT